ncbi:galactokinase [Streptomyces oceani]|uniref:Galactokinase n=1 Tax=Streptomyces oceani TaxID=1075402 RepID=A0A1E7KMY3_9ACTN|nr:galactokinase [Streptomyces oceani]OEV05305.1 galactokinase [Streptomyces oceani]
MSFQEVYGAAPEGVWAAPGRVNLIGEHTDYNDGFVLPFALPHATRVHAARRDDGLLRLYSADTPDGVVTLSLDTLKPGDTDGWAAYPAGVAWALRAAELPVGGADLYVESTVPTGAGLSSSAALEVATALALNDLYGLDLPRDRLARLCQRAENDFVGMPCGIMDQMASACGTEGHALYLDTRDMTSRQVPFDLETEGLRLLVVDTRVRHELADGEYAKRRAGCEEGARRLGVPALRDVPYAQLAGALERLEKPGAGVDAGPAAAVRAEPDTAAAQRGDTAGPDPAVRDLVRHVVTENQRVAETIRLLEHGRPRAAGPLLNAGHASLRDDFRISCRELDLVVDTATAAGALGARMTGGGFGGSAIVLLEVAHAERVTEAVRLAFERAGHREPRVFTALPGPGARRE